ncbi:MAG: HipA domain-containing protein, partial [Pseudomonadota bacterium]|nr:HipA domain-containing protein [Pseudomonadota bacterium]
GLPTRYGDTQNTDIVLKMEKTTIYPGIVELEEMGLEVHRAAGMEVPRSWLVDLSGVYGIAIERFDRTAQRIPRFMESLYSVLASADLTLLTHYDTTYDRIGRAVNSVDIRLVDDRKAAQSHLLQRLVMAMLTGNGDLHLMNLSLLKTESGTGFSPVYDPTAMRAYSKHNEMVPREMTFGDYGDWIDGQDDMVDFEQGMGRFIKGLGLSLKDGVNVIEKAFQDTEDYPDRVDDLKTLPGENKKQLIKIHHDMNSLLRRVK